MGRGEFLMKKNLNEHIWTVSGTDITERWRLKYGWVPPSELAEYQRKWTYYQELPLRKLSDEARKELEEVMRKNKVVRWKTV
jgi:hypothetical protein